MWRTNAGGGTASQGDASGISNPTRRADSYLDANLQWDPTRCEGQRYFLQQARTMGCPSIVLFSNTPPVHLMLNGKGLSFNGGKANLKADAYDAFADYLADVAAMYVKTGYPVTHISPINELQHNWESG